MGIIYFAVLFAYVLLVKNAFRRVFDDSQYSGPTLRSFRRSYIFAILFGFGFIGVEGFGLPVPPLIGILASFYLGWESLIANLIGLAVSWALLFAFFFFREHYIDYETNRSPRRHYGRFRSRK